MAPGDRLGQSFRSNRNTKQIRNAMDAWTVVENLETALQRQALIIPSGPRFESWWAHHFNWLTWSHLRRPRHRVAS